MYKAAEKFFNLTAWFMGGLMVMAGVVGAASGNVELFNIIPLTAAGMAFSKMSENNVKTIEKKRRWR